MVFRTYTESVLVEGDAIRHFTCEEAVLQGQVVKGGDASRTVEPSDADGEACLGVALYSASAGEKVAVARPGCVVRGTDGTGSIGNGEFLASHGATGEEGEVASAATGDYIVGQALEDGAGNGSTVVFEVVMAGQVN